VVGVLRIDATVSRSTRIALTGATLLAAIVGGKCVADPRMCSQLTLVKIAETSVQSADEVAPGSVIKSEFPPIESGPQPAHCLVRGEVGHHRGADGTAYGNKFELRLPDRWSGRLLFQGGGGLDGVVRPAVGLVVADPHANIDSALARGYAVVSTDAGHDQATLKSPGDFGADPQALADYEFNSTRSVMRSALAVIKTYYRHAPKRAYFMGCSEGGREGLIAAQRYPEVFDGIIAGAPAFHLSRAMIAEAWNNQAFAAVAPKNSGGSPSLAQAFSDQELQLVADAVLAKCDALDGVSDGLISDPIACHFDPQVLTCPAAQGRECLSADKVTALRKVFAGPKNSAGEPLYSDWVYDSGIAEFGWRLWMLGNAQMPALNLLIAPAAINGLALANRPPRVDIMHFDFDGDTQRLDAISPQLNATSVNYAGFRRRGAKLLLYTGVSDPIFSVADLTRYYSAVSGANGGSESTGKFARLFLVPGMNHCGGGKATDQFDTLAALEDWVEQGKAPDRIIARGAAFPGRTRPLCPYPTVARYSGSGDIESAESFNCKL
jgi:pimeloyl-ACP methyl ester carboxylesterase